MRLLPTSGGAVLRIALDAPAGQIKDFSLQDPFRIVLDIYRPKDATGSPGAQGGAAQPLRLVVLDAGHGGHDSGATGPTGVREKDVVLDVTRRVARMMEESGLGIKVVLTRSGDTFVPLRDRTIFANKQRADLFVSIHANAHPRSVSEGVETYFLSSEASDTEARQTAAVENGVVQLESAASRQKMDAIKSILWDLAQSEFQQESSFLAETVQDSMTRSLRLVNRGIKQAGFYVLGGAAMPAILIEIGFLTNPREEKKLATAEYREAAAKAIFAGLSDYKRRYDQRMRAALPKSAPLSTR
jgi:N-acetylmuramoyl-L-alanine amidase